MINRNGSGKTHTQFGVVCVRFVFSDVKAPSGTLFVFAHCIYIYYTHIHTEEKGLAQWRCVYKCVCVPTLLFNSF